MEKSTKSTKRKESNEGKGRRISYSKFARLRMDNNSGKAFMISWSKMSSKSLQVDVIQRS